MTTGVPPYTPPPYTPPPPLPTLAQGAYADIGLIRANSSWYGSYNFAPGGTADEMQISQAAKRFATGLDALGPQFAPASSAIKSAVAELDAAIQNPFTPPYILDLIKSRINYAISGAEYLSSVNSSVNAYSNAAAAYPPTPPYYGGQPPFGPYFPWSYAAFRPPYQFG